MANRRVVVIGAGTAGLAAALSLAARGLEVTVVERAARPGGKMRELTINAQPVDSGPTVFTMRWVFDELFAEVGKRLEDHLQLKPLDILARHAWTDGSDLDLFADEARSADAIGGFAGRADAEGYRAFCADARKIFEVLKKPFICAPAPSMTALLRGSAFRDLTAIKPFQTMWKALGRYFTDPRLQQLFGRYATYCGSSPFHAPATLMLVAHVESAGVWLVDGGMYRLATVMANMASGCGVEIRCGVEVAGILTDFGRVTGVELADGEQIHADAVIATADVAAIASGLFGHDPAKATAAVPDSARSLSAMTWSCLARTSGFPLLRHSVFFSRDYRAEFDNTCTYRQMPAEPTVYVCAQDRDDHAIAPTGEERLFILINAPANGDRHRYDPTEISQCARRTFGLLERCGLRVETTPELTQATTPTDFHRLFPGTGARCTAAARTAGWRRFSGRGADEAAGPLSRGRQCTSGPGRSDGGAVGPDGGGEPVRGPRFDRAVANNGYAWWYVDALSDDGKQGITIIAFVGSVFSPYYALARRFGDVDPLQHCALNVAIYGPKKRWAMTERRPRTVARSETSLIIGPSSIRWDGEALTIDIDEVTNPLPSRLRGRVRVHPCALTEKSFALDTASRHRWWPIAPCSRVQVDLKQPETRWLGEGYFDINHGVAPLEHDFVGWQWSRASTRRGTVVFYDTEPREDAGTHLALRFDRRGETETVEPLPQAHLPRTGWRISRTAHGDPLEEVKVTRTLEDTPFYARSQLSAKLFGETADVMHESLSLKRFRSPIVQAMLPFRMPRR